MRNYLDLIEDRIIAKELPLTLLLMLSGGHWAAAAKASNSRKKKAPPRLMSLAAIRVLPCWAYLFRSQWFYCFRQWL